MKRSNKILHDDQTTREKIFTGLTTPPALAIFFVTRMLTHDLFVVANFLVFINVLSYYLTKWL